MYTQASPRHMLFVFGNCIKLLYTLQKGKGCYDHLGHLMISCTRYNIVAIHWLRHAQMYFHNNLTSLWQSKCDKNIMYNFKVSNTISNSKFQHLTNSKFQKCKVVSNFQLKVSKVQRSQQLKVSKVQRSQQLKVSKVQGSRQLKAYPGETHRGIIVY